MWIVLQRMFEALLPASGKRRAVHELPADTPTLVLPVIASVTESLRGEDVALIRPYVEASARWQEVAR